MEAFIHNPVTDAILTRRTIRSYTEEPLTDEEIATLLQCAMWAPSGRNRQPCHVRVIRDKKLLDELNADFKDLVGWDTPAYTRWDVNPVYQTAPALFLLYAPDGAFTDAGIMVQNIAIAAEGLGLGSCIIGSVGSLLDAPEGAKWKKKLGIPEDWRFLISVAVGHKDENPEPKPRIPENFRVAEE